MKNQCLRVGLLIFLVASLPSGTVGQALYQLQDVFPGGSNTNSGPAFIGQTGYFQASSGSYQNLYYTDGTPTGTVRVLDGSASVNINTFGSSSISKDGLLYFSASAGLYKSNGTVAGTSLVKSFTTASFPTNFRIVGDQLFFTQKGLWKTDGTEQGTIQLAPDALTGSGDVLGVIGNQLLFSQGEPWITDGTIAGTRLLKKIGPQYSSGPKSVASLDNKVVFTASDNGGTSYRLYTSDGTTAGTVPLSLTVVGQSAVNASIRQDDGQFNGKTIEGICYFLVFRQVGPSWELWRTDGTGPGTYMIPDLTLDKVQANQRYLFTDDGLFIGSTNPADNSQVISQITKTGKKTWFNQPGTTIKQLHGYHQGVLYMAEANSNSQTFGHRNLWRTDGTPAGTYPVAIDPITTVTASTTANVVDFRNFFVINNTPYTAASVQVPLPLNTFEKRGGMYKLGGQRNGKEVATLTVASPINATLRPTDDQFEFYNNTFFSLKNRGIGTVISTVSGIEPWAFDPAVSSVQVCTLTVGLSGNPALPCSASTTAPLTAALTGGTAPFTYQWQRNALAISGATSATYAANETGNFSVLVTDSKSCSATSALLTVSGAINPSSTTSVNVTSQSADLRWADPDINLTTYELRYRAISPAITDYQSVTGITAKSYSLAGLPNQTVYEWQVRKRCGAGNSQSFTPPVSFTTQCTMPGPVGITQSGSNRAVLVWTSTEVGTPHEVQYQVQGSTTGWQSVTNITSTTPTHSSTLTGLKINTPYIVQVRAVCSASATSPFSVTTLFRTTACIAPTQLRVSSTANTSATLGFGAELGSRVELSYIPASQTATGAWTIAGSTTAVSTLTGYSLTGLTPDTDYAWRVRTFCSPTDSTAYVSGPVFRVECRVPTDLSSFNIGFSSALLSWNGGSGQTYEVQWRPQGATTAFLSATATGGSYSLQNLVAGAYEWQVRGLCGGGGSSAFAVPKSFTTVCAAPTPSTSDISSYGALLNWSSYNADSRYTIEYKPTSGTAWTALVDLGGYRYALPGLTNGTAYTWRIQNVCSASVTSAFSNSVTFTTTCNVPSVSLSSIGRTAVSLFVRADYGASCVVQWRPQGSTTWDYTSPVLNNFSAFGGSTSSDTYSLNNLSPGTVYEYQVKGVCADGVSSLNTRIFSVTTTSCNLVVPGSAGSTPSFSSATLFWSHQADRYEVRWRPVGSPTWNVATELISSGLALQGLTTNTAYEWQARAICADQTTPFSNLQTFTTTCGVVANLATCVSNSAARLTWTGPSGSAYNLLWRPVGGTWTTVSSLTATTYVLKGLRAASLYEWQVIPLCGSSSQSAVSGMVASFQTLTVCPGVANLTVSTSPSNCTAASVSWAGCSGSVVTFDVQYKLQSSATWLPAGTTGNTNFTVGGLVAGTAYDVRVRARCDATTDTLAFSTTSVSMPPCVCGTISSVTHSQIGTKTAFVTWNISGTAARYEVRWRVGKTTAWTSATTNSATYTLINLTTDTPYDWQVRPICADGQPGEYSLIAFLRTLCNIPDQPRTTLVSAQSAALGWNSVNSAYELRYRTGSGAWTTVQINTNTYSLTGLTNNTTYEWQVKAVCDGSVYSHSLFFTTQCAAPNNTFADQITPNSARLTWNGPFGYELQYRPLGGTFTTVNVTRAGSYTVTGLTPATVYDWQVRSLCDAGGSTSGYPAQPLTFQTLNANGRRISVDVPSTPALDEPFTLRLSPNPAETQVRIVVQLAQPGLVTMSIVSGQGQLFRNWSSVEEGQTYETVVDVTGWPVGLYLIRAEANGRAVTRKLLKR